MAQTVATTGLGVVVIAGDDALQADGFLVDEIRQGSESAWRQLITRYQGRLLAFAQARLRRGPDADDAVQETFIGFLQSLPHYDGSRSLETYLFAILRYKILDVCRERNVKPTVSFDPQRDGDVSVFLQTPAGEETPSGALRFQESADTRRRALADGLRTLITYLRNQDKFGDLMVIELIFFAGWRNKDVATTLQLDEKAVAGVKFRAVARLRETLETMPGSASLFTDVDAVTVEATLSSVWSERRLTCLKRSTLGGYALGTVDASWDKYIRFHLDTMRCPYCRANFEDIRAEADEHTPQPFPDRVFASSVGFLSRPSSPA